MTYEQICDVLGRDKVLAVESAFTEAFVAGRSRLDHEAGDEAARELLIALLAATILTPRATAVAKAEDAGRRLTAIVREALAV